MTNDMPVADRLDRSYFGFDQDYYERMPLLVNAMQESSYVDPSVEYSSDKTHIQQGPKRNSNDYTRPTRQDHAKQIKTPSMDHRISSIRRTSPRPFYFEYRSPTPAPFSKTYGSRSWVEGYRNTIRLRNLQQVIKYLEKTINAKFGDLYALPMSTHIGFSGVYVEPKSKDTEKTTVVPPDLEIEESKKVESGMSNHQSDPLFSFKPESPGDVNLLADGFFRFSPVPIQRVLKSKASSNIPMFRPIPYNKRINAAKNKEMSPETKTVNLIGSGEIQHPEPNLTEKPKAFSVTLNLFPLEPTNADFKKLEVTETPLNKIYLTTSRPVVQFRRRSTTPIRRTTTKKKVRRPKVLVSRHQYRTNVRPEQKTVEPRMVVHVNVFPPADIKTLDQSTTTSSPHRYFTEIPILTSTQVEDFHVGSSGIIPVEARLTPAPPPPIPTLPAVTEMIPFFDPISTSTTENSITTSQPEVLKFGAEDARVPDQYLRLAELASTTPTINRRTSQEFDLKEEDSHKGTREQDARDDNEKNINLIMKLLNEAESSTSVTSTAKEEDIIETTTFQTYVPQINGHYRSVNLSSRNVNSWINGNSESNRKRRLEMSITGFRKPTYVPQYVEIRRNNTRQNDEESDSESDDHQNDNEEE